MEEASNKDPEATASTFLDLPPEIHEEIILNCGVSEICSLGLVNHFLHNIVNSRLRDFLITGCQNGKNAISSADISEYFDDIHRLYFFLEDRVKLWKVVRAIRKRDKFRNKAVGAIRWDISDHNVIDKRRTVYVVILQLLTLVIRPLPYIMSALERGWPPIRGTRNIPRVSQTALGLSVLY